MLFLPEAAVDSSLTVVPLHRILKGAVVQCRKCAVQEADQVGAAVSAFPSIHQRLDTAQRLLIAVLTLILQMVRTVQAEDITCWTVPCA